MGGTSAEQKKGREGVVLSKDFRPKGWGGGFSGKLPRLVRVGNAGLEKSR